MATDNIANLLKAGIDAAKAGNKVEARRLLEQVLEKDDNNETAWMWYASVVDSAQKRRICLENVLEINPNNTRAREALEKLGPAGKEPAAPKPSAPASRPPTPAAQPASAPRWAGDRGPAARRRGRNPLFFIGGGIVALGLIVAGLLLATSGTPAVTPTPANQPTATLGTVVAVQPTLNLTEQAQILLTGVPPTWTPAPTSTPLPTATATATLPPLIDYHLVFVGEGRGKPNPSLYSINANGSNEAIVLDDVFPIKDFSVSSNGQIAFAGVENGKPQIFVTDVFANNPNVVTKLDAKTLYSPVWSPDGKKIAYVSDEAGNKEIYIMNADGSQINRVTNNKVEDRDPSWSPDGTKLLYASDPTGKHSLELFVRDLKTNKDTQLSDAANDSYSPSFSPDGKLIVFGSTRDRYPNIYTMNADGSNVQLVTYESPGSSNQDPAWTLDGKYIAFASNRANTKALDLFIMTPNGKNIQQITKGTGSSYSPRFRR